MAGPIGTKDADVVPNKLLSSMRKEPWSFGFFQAVRLLQLAAPGRTPVGKLGDPATEVVRFLQNPSLAFPASEIQKLEEETGQADRMTVNFFGMIGPLGPLPLHYTEFAIERLRARDRSFLEFLNIFHHRLASAFYRAWEKHRFPIGYERDRTDLVSEMLYDLVGLGTYGLRKRQVVPDEVFVHYGGFFALAARSAVTLESILADYFELPVEVEQFIGAWRRIDETDQCRFEDYFSESTQLGLGAVVGDEIWDRQSKARIVLGPLPGSRYREFLPNGSAFRPLRALTRMFSGDDIEYEVQLILEREDVLGCELGRGEEKGVQLGWFTWMKSKAGFDRDPRDTVLLLT